MDIESTSRTAMLQAFADLIEARLAAPEAKPAIDISNVDPRLKSIFTTAVATACDFVDLSPLAICEQFLHLAAAGLDSPLVERPPHVKINQRFEPLLPVAAHDRPMPIIRPTEPGMPLGLFIA